MKRPITRNNNKGSYSGNEMKRYLGALTETHNEHLKTIKENSLIINKKMDGMKEILGSHTEMIGVLLEDVSTLKSDMVVVKEDLLAISGDLKKKVDYEEFLTLVKRVQNLEASA